MHKLQKCNYILYTYVQVAFHFARNVAAASRFVGYRQTSRTNHTALAIPLIPKLQKVHFSVK